MKLDNGVEVCNGLNNSSGGAIDGGQGRTVDGAGAVGSLDGRDISCINSTSGECGVEVGGIGVQVSDRLNNGSSGAVDGGQVGTIDGASAVGGFYGCDVCSDQQHQR